MVLGRAVLVRPVVLFRIVLNSHRTVSAAIGRPHFLSLLAAVRSFFFIFLRTLLVIAIFELHHFCNCLISASWGWLRLPVGPSSLGLEPVNN